jgi:hypothetical protein
VEVSAAEAASEEVALEAAADQAAAEQEEDFRTIGNSRENFTLLLYIMIFFLKIIFLLYQC